MDKAVIGVVGTGLMGVGIATQSALHGHRTIVHDVDPARLASVAPKAEAVLDELIDAGRIDQAAKQAALARIETHAQLDVMASAQFVIEAIPEVLELKHRLYAALAELMADDAILASNTSGFPPDQLVAPLRAKERFLIAHFWNPPHMIPLVEVVPGTATAPEVTERTAALMSAIGMEPVVLAKANQALSKVTAARWAALFKRGAVSAQDNDTRQADYQAQTANVVALEEAVAAAQQNVGSLQANLDRLLELQSYEQVRAPFSGVVTLRNVDVGALITTGETLLFRVAQVDRLRTYVNVPESNASQVQVGQGATFYFSLPKAPDAAERTADAP